MFTTHNRRGARAFSLVEILVVMVILMVLAAFILPRYLGGRTEDGKKTRAPITMARDTVCQSNIKQVRLAIDTARTSDPDAKPPQSLDELKLGSELTRCEVGHEAYVYDPQAGTVRCPHPGHENY